MPRKEKDDALETLRAVVGALLAAPDPRVYGGPPRYWSWWDGPRAQALSSMSPDVLAAFTRKR